MKTELQHDFSSLFGQEPVLTAQAPGRVNLIGEHIDYNGGFVLPTPIPQFTQVELAPGRDDNVRAWSAQVEAGLEWYRIGREEPGYGWLDYLQGVTKILREERYPVKGFDIRISSAVPLGSGLSSSAAFEIAVMRGLRELFGLQLDDVKMAQLGQRVENDFVGASVGIMDQMASSLGKEGQALFLNCRTLEYEHVPLPQGVELVVINSGVVHNNAGGDFNIRRNECRNAAEILGVKYLTDLTPAELARVKELPATLARRARHVITENARVKAAVEAFKANDLEAVRELFYASHESMRFDYETSIPETDFLIESARKDQDIAAARLTGAGWGGSVVMLAFQNKGMDAAKRITELYSAKFESKPQIILPLA